MKAKAKMENSSANCGETVCDHWVRMRKTGIKQNQSKERGKLKLEFNVMLSSHFHCHIER